MKKMNGRQKTRDLKRSSVLRKVITSLALLCFMGSTVFSGNVSAEVTDVLSDPEIRVYRDMSFDLRNGLFELPKSLGYIQDSFLGNPGKVVVHIQDAHCDYYAQRAIRKLIKYFKTKYGVTLICLEGGIGEYDLTPFTDISNIKIRKEVADLFLKEGILNAAEFAYVENPEKFLLWGVENVELYKKNLSVFRRSVKYQKQIKGYLKQLSLGIANLKKKIYSERLLQFDLKYFQYKTGSILFNEYLSYVIEEAKKDGVSVKTFHNLHLLKQVFDAEEKIDFRQADAERDNFVEDIKETMSSNQAEELVKETVRFSTGELTPKEYYNYLVVKGKRTEIDVADYASFQAYIVYISMYTSVEKSQIFKDLRQLEDILRDNMCAADEQKELLQFSKHFTLMKKAFSFSLAKDDFDYFGKYMDDYKIEDFLSFLKKTARQYRVKLKIPKEILELNERLREIKPFYVYSFERDKVFIGGMKEKMKTSGFYNTFLVTGGFHTENVTELLRKEDLSYVSILPRFKDKKGYESPYFKILSGGNTSLGETIIEAVSASTMQVASIWNRLGLKVAGEKPKNLAMVQLAIAEKLVQGKDAVLAVRKKEETEGGITGGEKTNIFIRFHLENGRTAAYAFEKVEEGREPTADVFVSDSSKWTTKEYKEYKRLETGEKASVEDVFGSFLFEEKKVLDFFEKAEIKQEYLVDVNNIERKVKIVSFEKERLSKNIIKSIKNRGKNISFVIEKDVFGRFFQGWSILTIQDNEYTSGFVDVQNKILYITETIHAASKIAPRIVPIIILSEISRIDRPFGNLNQILGLQESKNTLDSVILVRGLSVVKNWVLKRALRANEEKGIDGIQRSIVRIQNVFKSTGVVNPKFLEDFNSSEMRLVEINQNRVEETGRLGHGLIDQLFGRDFDNNHWQLMHIVRNMDGSRESFEKFADSIIRMQPGSWVCFADGMEGRGREDSLGSSIMDVLSPEARIRVLAEARKEGIFAYGYGRDEHAFIFPPTYSANRVKEFFLKMTKKLEEVSGYALYVLAKKDIPENVNAKITEIRKIDKGVQSERVSGNLHLLVSRNLVDQQKLEEISPGVLIKEKEIKPFYMPASGIRITGGITPKAIVPFRQLLARAEAGVQKWREEELRGMTPEERDGIWKNLTKDQQQVVSEMAWRRLSKAEKEKERSINGLSSHKAVLRGLPGFPKHTVFLKEVEPDKMGPKQKKGFSVLKEPKSLEDIRETNKRQTLKHAKKLFGIAREKGKEHKHVSNDIFTGYDVFSLKTLLEEIFSMSPEDRKNLPEEERMIMVRGPPVDFYLVLIDNNGDVSVLNIDMMCHAQGLEGQEKIEKELKVGLGGRESDYVLTDEKKRLRLFPFKALNSYVGHLIADDYIAATYHGIAVAFKKLLEEKSWNIGETIKNAAQIANDQIDPENFKIATKGKQPLEIVLEAHLVKGVDVGGRRTLHTKTDPETEEHVNNFLEELQAMRAVRDPEVIKKDRELLKNEKGEIVGRLRVHSSDPDRVEDYRKAYEKQRKISAEVGGENVQIKNVFFQEENNKLEEQFKKDRAKEIAEKMYGTSGKVAGNITDVKSPLVVFIPAMGKIKSRKETLLNNAKRVLRKQYGVENLSVYLYNDTKEGLAEGKNRISESKSKRVWENPDTRFVVFCTKESGIHPEGVVGKDIFKKKNKSSRAYYINEQYYPEEKEQRLLNPLIGPHIALAMGIKQFMADKDANKFDRQLLFTINSLLAQLSGLKDVEDFEMSKEDLDAVANRLVYLLAAKDTLQIRKLDFESLEDEIKAEEGSMKSL